MLNNKIKNLFLILILIISIFTLTSCDDITSGFVPSGEIVTLPDLRGMSREEIEETLQENNIKYVLKFDYTSVSELKYDQFVKYEKDYQSGDTIDSSYQIYVYTTLLPLDFDYSSEIVFDLDYEGKNFLEDGIGKVTLAKAVDGDTAHFYDENNNYIKVRFLGINTPESTYEKDAWGKAASDYTKERLNSANEIILEAEGPRQDAYERYLAFVWIDGELLNLELVQEAYSYNNLSKSSKYYDTFFKAYSDALKTGRRIYGEIDPHYDYETKKFI